MEASPPPKSTTTNTTTAPPLPPPPPLPQSLLRHLITVDKTLSQRLHLAAKSFLPHFLLIILELSADFRFFFPLSLSLLFAPTAVTLTPIPGPNPTLIAILRPLLSPLILGLLLDLALIGLIKTLFRRPRPVYNKNMSVAVSIDNFSFPSGHASRVCFIAALFQLSAVALVDVLAHLRSASPSIDSWVGADQAKTVSASISVAWAWAVATAVSRILLGRHFVSDVFVGACLGVLEALIAFHFLKL